MSRMLLVEKFLGLLVRPAETVPEGEVLAVVVVEFAVVDGVVGGAVD